MKRTYQALALCLSATALLLAFSACGKTATDVPPASSAAPVESAPAPVPMESTTLAGTLIGASMNNVMIRTSDGIDLDFVTIDAEITTVDGLIEGDWVSVTYLGTINGTDTTGVQVTLVEDDSQHAKATAETTAVTAYDTARTLYTTGPLHVRSSYSDVSEILATLPKGTAVEVVGEAPNGWKEIKYEGKQCFVFGDYLSETKPVAKPESAKVDGVVDANFTAFTTTALRMRATPSLDSEVYGVVAPNTGILITGEYTSGWFRVLYNGIDAYCDAEYITMTPPAGSTAFIAGGIPDGVKVNTVSETHTTTVSLRLHTAATLDAPVTAVVKQGTELQCTGVLDNGWTRVEYDGKTVFCVTEYLT